MGVKFGRDYKDIINELADALRQIDNCCEAFEMELADWEELDPADQKEYVRTLADDVFYALGSSPKMAVGSGYVQYDASVHIIKVFNGPRIVHIINLKQITRGSA